MRTSSIAWVVDDDAMRVVSQEFPYTAADGEFMGRLVIRDDLDPTAGKSLGEWTAEHGWAFELDGPDGERHAVSLDPWRAMNPDTTFLSIAFHGLPMQLYTERVERGEEPFRDGPGRRQE